MPTQVRPMHKSDISHFPAAFAAQGWDKPRAQYEEYFLAQEAGDFLVLVADYDGEPAGYLLLYPEAKNGPFAGNGVPYIVDFNVLEKFQRRGIGNALMDAAEKSAAERADAVCLGVGLHSGYGAAQRMYAKRGYLPDGSGLWYKDAPLAPYAPCANDDDLVLYMMKRLR